MADQPDESLRRFEEVCERYDAEYDTVLRWASFDKLVLYARGVEWEEGGEVERTRFVSAIFHSEFAASYVDFEVLAHESDVVLYLGHYETSGNNFLPYFPTWRIRWARFKAWRTGQVVLRDRMKDKYHPELELVVTIGELPSQDYPLRIQFTAEVRTVPWWRRW